MSLITKEEVFKKLIAAQATFSTRSGEIYSSLLFGILEHPRGPAYQLSEEDKAQLTAFCEAMIGECGELVTIVGEYTGDSSFSGFFRFMNENTETLLEFMTSPEGKEALLMASGESSPDEQGSCQENDHTPRMTIRRPYSVEAMASILRHVEDLLPFRNVPEKQLEMFKGLTLVSFRIAEDVSKESGNEKEVNARLQAMKNYILSLSV